VALMPSVPGANPPHSARALLGLLAGAVVALGPAPLPDRIRTGAVVVLLGSGLAAGAWLGHGRLAEVWSARANLDSSGRSGALRAALELIGQRPWTGTGVGRAAFLWPTPDGHGAVALYAHNEYVQMLVDLGVIGGVLLLILIVAVGGHLYRGRGPGHRPGVREGAVAGVTAFAVHSAFDFLWHIPVLLLAAGLLIGLAGPVPHSEVWVATQRGRA
jgi:O-antigen ligase